MRISNCNPSYTLLIGEKCKRRLKEGLYYVMMTPDPTNFLEFESNKETEGSVTVLSNYSY